LLGNAILDAAIGLRKDLENSSLEELSGKVYSGNYACNWTNKPGEAAGKIITHYSYGYAAQLVILDNNGEIAKVVAAHTTPGKIMNSMLFEGRYREPVHMGCRVRPFGRPPDGKQAGSSAQNSGIAGY